MSTVKYTKFHERTEVFKLNFVLLSIFMKWQTTLRINQLSGVKLAVVVKSANSKNERIE